MKTILFVIALALLVFPAIPSAEPDHLKTKALTARFNGFNLNNPNGGVGGKIWLSEQRALVLGMNASLSSDTREGDSLSVDEKTDRTNVGITLGLEQHIGAGNRFSPYITGGLSAGHQRYKRVYGNTFSPSENKDMSAYAGITAGLGVEYWITRQFSLTGQQLLSVNYRYGSSKSESSSSQTSRDIWGYDMGLGTSSLILSAYF